MIHVEPSSQSIPYMSSRLWTAVGLSGLAVASLILELIISRKPRPRRLRVPASSRARLHRSTSSSGPSHHPNAAAVQRLIDVCSNAASSARVDGSGGGAFLNSSPNQSSTDLPPWWAAAALTEQAEHSGRARADRGTASPAPVPAGLDETRCVIVKRASQLRRMEQELQGHDAIAVDLEHHALHSYSGIVCTLQISTSTTDYLVDALALRHQLSTSQPLRELLADSRVTKVLHGCSNDVLWLQRDFHLFLVNVFDTERAAALLGYKSRSLAALLHQLCGVEADKRLQTADWRVRPLSRDMVRYLRTDTHYSLYIAQQLRDELQQLPYIPAGNGGTQPSQLGGGNRSAARLSPALALALQRSQQMSLQVYSAPTSEAQVAAAVANLTRRLQNQHQHQPTKQGRGGTQLSFSGPSGLSAAELHARLQALCSWREEVARAEDESPGAVLPDAVVLALATAGPLVHGRRELEQLCALHGGLPKPAARKAGLKVKGLFRALADAKQAAGQANTTGDGGISSVAPEHVPAPAHQGASDTRLSLGARQLQRVNPDKREALIKKFSAKSQVYESCMMLSTGGELLCFCDRRKLQWYVNKGLAEWVNDDPPTVRLLFEHKNSDQSKGVTFYSQSRLNRCVVCGEEGHYLRYRIVPACYRHHFPPHLKTHRSHDVVLLCIACHQTAHSASEAVKRQVAAEFGVPLNPPRSWTHPHLGQDEGGDQDDDAEPRGPHKSSAAAVPQDTADSSAQSGTPAVEMDGSDEDGLVDEADDEGGQQEGEEPQAAESQVGGSQPEDSEEDQSLAGDAAAQPLLRRQEDSAGGSSIRRTHMAPGRQQGTTGQAVSNAQGRRSPSLANGVTVSGARRAALALQRSAAQMPAARVAELHSLIWASLGRQPTEGGGLRRGELEAALVLGLGPKRRQQLLEGLPPDAAAAAQSAVEGAANAGSLAARGAGHSWHGERVVAAAKETGGEQALLDLVKRFRVAFVQACQPRYLPPGWDVEHEAPREFGPYSAYAAPEDTREQEEGGGSGGASSS